MNDTLPLDTYMTCWWDNGAVHPSNAVYNLTNPVVAAPNQTFNVPHNFSTAGDFTLRCNMSNFVSSQMLEFNVWTMSSLMYYMWL